MSEAQRRVLRRSDFKTDRIDALGRKVVARLHIELRIMHDESHFAQTFTQIVTASAFARLSQSRRGQPELSDSRGVRTMGWPFPAIGVTDDRGARLGAEVA